MAVSARTIAAARARCVSSSRNRGSNLRAQQGNVEAFALDSAGQVPLVRRGLRSAGPGTAGIVGDSAEDEVRDQDSGLAGDWQGVQEVVEPVYGSARP